MKSKEKEELKEIISKKVREGDQKLKREIEEVVERIEDSPEGLKKWSSEVRRYRKWMGKDGEQIVELGDEIKTHAPLEEFKSAKKEQRKVYKRIVDLKIKRIRDGCSLYEKMVREDYGKFLPLHGHFLYSSILKQSRTIGITGFKRRGRKINLSTGPPLDNIPEKFEEVSEIYARLAQIGFLRYFKDSILPELKEKRREKWEEKYGELYI